MGLGKTEFEDILIDHGILKAPEQPAPEEQVVYDTSNKYERDPADIDDDEDIDDDAFFEEYRRKRMAEMRQNCQVTEISRPDFCKEVTEASARCPVIVHLYNDSVEESVLLKQRIRTAASQYPRIKFVEIVASRCIPDYPDGLVPTILYYRDGNVVQQVTKAKPDGLTAFLDVIMESLEK